MRRVWVVLLVAALAGVVGASVTSSRFRPPTREQSASTSPTSPPLRVNAGGSRRETGTTSPAMASAAAPPSVLTAGTEERAAAADAGEGKRHATAAHARAEGIGEPLRFAGRRPKMISRAAAVASNGGASGQQQALADRRPGVEGPFVSPPIVPTSLQADLRTLLARPRRAIRAPEKELRRLRPGVGGTRAPELTDPVAQTWAGTENMPTASLNIKGMDLQHAGAGWPPDPNGDVGPNHYIQTVNTSIQIFNKDGSSAVPPATFDTLFATAPAPCSSSNKGDVVVVYDRLADRWVITDFAWTSNSGPFYECIAVSKNSDPVSGGWWLYAMNANDTWLNDYPKFGVWADGYYMSANMWQLGPPDTFKGTRVWAFNRAELINGQPLHAVWFDISNDGGLLPANIRGVLPPQDSTELFVDIEPPNGLHLWQFHVDWATPSSSTFSGPTWVTVAPFTTFPFGTYSISQKGSSETLDQIDDRFMMQAQYRRVGNTESLWLNHTVVSGGVAAVRWYEIRDPNGSAAVYQQGTYQPDASHRWMASLGVDGSGNMAVGYSVSGSSLYPSIRYAGRLATDPLGQLPQGETGLVEGTGSQNGGYHRWGDYSAMTVDPVDDCTFWYTSEYYEATGQNWQTRIGAFAFPGCAPRVPAIGMVTPLRVRPGSGAFTVTVTGTNFVNGDTVLWNGSPRATTFVSGGELQALVTAADVATAGTAQVTVKSSVPSAAPSASVTIVIGVNGDFNGDGNPDILWRDRITGEIIFWLMNGTALGSEVRLAGPTDRNWTIAAIADFNDDAKPDLLWRNIVTGENQIWYMNWTSHTSSATLPAVPDVTWQIVAAADFNPDGKPDILWRSTATGDNILWYMNGAAYAGHARLPAVGDTNWTIAALDDFNGDGAPDLLWRNQATGENILWFMNGAAYVDYAQLAPESDVHWIIAGTADYNGDGSPDIVWRNVVTGENKVTYLNGVTAIGSDALPAMTNPDWDLLRPVRSVKPAGSDFNADGWPDIVWRNTSTGENRIWYLNGATHVTDGTVDTEPNLDWKSVAVADFNGDGLPDIVWRNQATGENKIWLMTGATHSGDMTLPTIADTSWRIVGAADFNQDGHPDLVWRNQSTGQNVIWFLHNGAYYDWTAPPTIPDTTWQIVAVGDFNGDGWPDLMWRNQSSGVNIVWFLVNGVYAGWAAPPTIADTTWQIVGAADFNGDGKADLLWRNAADGRNLVWYLNNGAYLGFAWLPTLSTEWKTGPGQ
jgi:hypothetical protein